MPASHRSDPVTPAVQTQVRRFDERLAGASVCDGCITERLSLSEGVEVAQIAFAMTGDHRFERGKDVCGLCGLTKATTRLLRA